MPALHQKEDCAQYRGILAQMKNVRSFSKVRMDRLEYSKFTCHVVSFGGDRAKGSAPQHVLTPINPQHIRKVRMPVRKLFDGDAPFGAFNFPAQKIRKSSYVQFFA